MVICRKRLVHTRGFVGKQKEAVGSVFYGKSDRTLCTSRRLIACSRTSLTIRIGPANKVIIRTFQKKLNGAGRVGRSRNIAINSRYYLYFNDNFFNQTLVIVVNGNLKFLNAYFASEWVSNFVTSI